MGEKRKKNIKIAYVLFAVIMVFETCILPRNVSSHTVDCCGTYPNQSLWLQLDSGFWTWLNTQCSNIFNDPIMRNFITCLLQKTTDASGGQCRCKEPPYDCTISSYTPKDLLTQDFTVPGTKDVTIKEFYITSWNVTSSSCSISIVDDATTSCPGAYPSYDYIRVSITLNIQANVRLVVDQTKIGGTANDNYYGQINISATPAEAGINLYLRHIENFQTPSLASCNGSTLQDVGVSLAYLFLGNPASFTFRWTSLPARRYLAQLVAFIEATLRYQSFNKNIIAGVKPYLGPMSVYDLKDLMGTDLINNPAQTRPCRSGGKFSHPITGTIYYDLGIETGFCAIAGPGALIPGSINIDIDYVLPTGNPPTMGCTCPNVSVGPNPCGGSHVCAAIHCSFFQRLWCLLVNEKVLHIEDPPNSNVPVSKNTPGIFGSLMGSFGTCENWLMFIPPMKNFCPSGSGKLIGIRAVPTGCGSAACGATMNRPQGGTLQPYPVDLQFYVPYDFEFWINDAGWKRLMSLLVDLRIGFNLAWWYCAIGVGSPCQSFHRVAYLGAVIDPDITGVQTDSTHPSFPGSGGWVGVLADIIGVLLSGNLFGAAYVGFGLRRVIDPDAVIPLPPGPPNLDPVPGDTYTPGTFADNPPNLNSSIDVSGGFLRARFNITGQLTARWLTKMIDENMNIAPPLNAKTAILPETLIINHTEPKWTGMEIQVDAAGGEDIMYVWRIDGGVWRGPERTNKIVLPGLLEGYHKFEVAAVDNKTGLYDPTPAKLEFLVDSLGPDIYTNLQQDKVRSGFVVKVKAVDSWTPEDKIQISWRIDDGDWTDWTYEKEIKLDLPEGQHKIDIKARDLKGNESIWSKVFFIQKEVMFGCQVR